MSKIMYTDSYRVGRGGLSFRLDQLESYSLSLLSSPRILFKTQNPLDGSRLQRSKAAVDNGRELMCVTSDFTFVEK